MKVNKGKIFKIIYFYKRKIIILFLLGLFSSGFSLISPYISKLFIDKAFLNRNLKNFLDLSVLSAALFVSTVLIRVISDTIKNKISVKLKLDLSKKFIKKFYSLDISFFQARSTGENIYRLSDSDALSAVITEQAPALLVDLLRLPIMLSVAFCLNMPMTAALLILSPLFLLHSLYLQKRLKAIYENMWRHNAELSKRIYEAFSKILLIKVFGWEAKLRRNFIKSLIENIRWKIKSFKWLIVSSVSSSFLSKAVFGLITLYGGWLIIRGSLSLGTYAAIMLYLKQAGGILQSLGNTFENFARQAVSIEKFSEIMNTQPLIKDSPCAVKISAINEIRFENVRFGYDEGRAVLKDLNLTMPAYSWVGVVGPSGCGKTTLINLLLRLYDPQAGKILLNGIDLTAIKLELLRERVVIATQQPLLFDISIGENIAYGLKDVDEADITEAARIACVDEFISQLPKRYDTLIGEDACRLSQGLKQRISIARAVIRKPDLLILDEAASSVDSFTEEKIFTGLRQKRKGKNTIIISHRLFSVKDADRIYFLKQDASLEEGTHQELLSNSQVYRHFFHNQLDEEVIKEGSQYP